eukprot:13168513-Alexandrium_andersonii.AAC.1
MSASSSLRIGAGGPGLLRASCSSLLTWSSLPRTIALPCGFWLLRRPLEQIPTLVHFSTRRRPSLGSGRGIPCPGP